MEMPLTIEYDYQTIPKSSKSIERWIGCWDRKDEGVTFGIGRLDTGKVQACPSPPRQCFRLAQ